MWGGERECRPRDLSFFFFFFKLKRSTSSANQVVRETFKLLLQAEMVWKDHCVLFFNA